MAGKSIKIVFSGEDAVGSNVAAQLAQKFGFLKQEPLEEGGKSFENWLFESTRKNSVEKIFLIRVEERLSTQLEYAAQLPGIFSAEMIFFASRHRSESGTPCFTSHAPGNFTENSEFGGNPFELGTTNARASTCLLRWLKKNANNNLGEFGVFREATHHGPTSLAWPSVFCELGSTEKEWVNKEAAGHVAEAIMFAAENYAKEEENFVFNKGKISVGFGGTHYCSKFSQLEFEGKNCFSPVASKHVLDGIGKEAVGQAMEKTVEKIDEVLLDWKGTNQAQREKLLKIFGELGIGWKRV